MTAQTDDCQLNILSERQYISISATVLCWRSFIVEVLRLTPVGCFSRWLVPHAGQLYPKRAFEHIVEPCPKVQLLKWNNQLEIIVFIGA